MLALQNEERGCGDKFVQSMEEINQKPHMEKLKRGILRAHDESRLKTLHQSHNKFTYTDKS